MAVKNYGIRDQWTNIDKLNNVDIKSVDGVIESVKINGEEAGGGGSSDFSTAEVTFNKELAVVKAQGLTVGDNTKGLLSISNAVDENTEYPVTLEIVLYKGKATAMWTGENAPTITGDITFVDENYDLIVTGPGTITDTEE